MGVDKSEIYINLQVMKVQQESALNRNELLRRVADDNKALKQFPTNQFV